MATLDKPKFLEAMKKCLPGVELGASTIQGADTFLLTPGAIHTYNDTIAVTTPVDTGDLSGAVKANDLYKLLSKMNAPIVTATITGNKLHISGGRNKSTLGLVDDSKVRAYIATLGLENAEWQPLPEGFMASVKVCKLSGNKSVFRGVCVGVAPDGENSQVFTTDESRICVAPLRGSMPSIWIDDPVIADLTFLDHLGSTQLILQFQDLSLQFCLLVFRCIVLRVLRQVSKGSGFLQFLRDPFLSGSLHFVEFRFFSVVLLLRHQNNFFVHGR